MSSENRNDAVHSKTYLDKVKEWDKTVEKLRSDIWLFLSEKDSLQESLTVEDISNFL